MIKANNKKLNADPLYYFAYGSNLDQAQMKSRCPGSSILNRAYLPHYVLSFKSNGRSGVATIVPSQGEFVEGAIYRITPHDLAQLDRYEGHPFIYKRHEIKVFTYDHEQIKALTYILKPSFPPELPAEHYLAKIQKGYAELNIPTYKLIQAYESISEEDFW
ncbi:gamma-glutamylcyclotransferase family protein [Paenibacillus sp. GCM10027627]|uniref:gamma-glutamylcyclotransferase family protein n=1 Tax=unclassified Paenibacillus TaxID=185978 RepID=UPI00362E68D6